MIQREAQCAQIQSADRHEDRIWPWKRQEREREIKRKKKKRKIEKLWNKNYIIHNKMMEKIEARERSRSCTLNEIKPIYEQRANGNGAIVTLFSHFSMFSTPLLFTLRLKHRIDEHGYSFHSSEYIIQCVQIDSLKHIKSNKNR